MKTKLYFAYGSNLNLADLVRAGFKPEELRAFSPAYLPDRELAFTRYSYGREGGVLDVRPKKGAVVPGALLKIANLHVLKKLDRKEGAPNAYRRINVTCLLPDGTQVEAITYEVIPSEREDFVMPTPKYVDIVSKGLADAGFSDKQLQDAASNTQNASDVNSLVVYGTLMSGQERHHVLKSAKPVLQRDVCFSGKLWDLGGYPGVTLGTGKSRRYVSAERYQFSTGTLPLDRLDDIEGFLGYGAQDNLFYRALLPKNVFALQGDLAWVYVYQRELGLSHLIESGNWRERGNLVGSFN